MKTGVKYFKEVKTGTNINLLNYQILYLINQQLQKSMAINYKQN